MHELGHVAERNPAATADEQDDVEIATVVVQALGALAWPAVVAFVLWTFREPLGQLLTSGTVTVKGPGGIEVSTAARAAATTALQDAAAAKATPLDPASARTQVDQGAAAVAARPSPPRVLWVDDAPSGNRLEREVVARLGMAVEEVVSTDAAVQAVLRSAPFDVIVSDLQRPESATAGYDLLDRLHAAGVRTPFVLYSATAHYDQAVGHGAVGSTDDPAELLDLIVEALRR